MEHGPGDTSGVMHRKYARLELWGYICPVRYFYDGFPRFSPQIHHFPMKPWAGECDDGRVGERTPEITLALARIGAFFGHPRAAVEARRPQGNIRSRTGVRGLSQIAV